MHSGLLTFSHPHGMSSSFTLRPLQHGSPLQHRVLVLPAMSAMLLAAGAFSLGAVAMGAVAVGALAIGKASVGRADIKELYVGRLQVDELIVVESTGPEPGL